MSSSLCDTFFKELKHYNNSNFKTLLEADLSSLTPEVHKSCSSVVTRYFIFAEKHPELSPSDLRMLYYKLRIDMVARYFSEYPSSNISDLKPFQEELKRFVQKEQEEVASNGEIYSAI